MSSIVPGVTVNGVLIPPDRIGAEVQYHPAESLPEARYRAMEALVVQELLRQRVVGLGLCTPTDSDGPDAVDEAVEGLLEREIDVPEPDPEACRRYYENNPHKFLSAPLAEVSHILYAAPPDDAQARRVAKERAQAALERIRTDPQVFEAIARAESACPSGPSGGFLGQVGKGQTLPAFEDALFAMAEGEISARPVETSVGYHLLWVHRCVHSQPLPVDVALERIADHLRKKAWLTAFHRYVHDLAAQATISGFRLKTAQAPLMQ
ncbi:MAG TPA: peptidylprolyl isomerase [Alphaproteobacteria bacterium]|nr:peptidylprolyl isomerase [Alphaproteobacteria bacterium]